jgi:CRP-like cAMP-binding protein
MELKHTGAVQRRESSRGLSTNGAFAFPLTQDNIADITGLGVVHVNRWSSKMRRDGQIDLSRGRLIKQSRKRPTSSTDP